MALVGRHDVHRQAVSLDLGDDVPEGEGATQVLGCAVGGLQAEQGINGGKPKIAIVPRSLHRLIYGPDKRSSPSLDDDLVVNLCTSEHLLVHHPMLEGILLSECERLKQHSLANKLISLFRQFGGTELRLKLVWLCWLDLMTGNSLDDWTKNLKHKSEKDLEQWIIARQGQSEPLTNLMDQYVLMAYRTSVDAAHS